MQKTWLHSTNKLKRGGWWTFFQEKYLHRLKFTQENLVLPQKLATSPQICSFTRKVRKKHAYQETWSTSIRGSSGSSRVTATGSTGSWTGCSSRLGSILGFFFLTFLGLASSDLTLLAWKISHHQHFESITSATKSKQLWNDSLTIDLSVLQ